MIFIGEGMLRPVVLIEVVPAVALAAVVAVAYVGGFLSVWFYLAAMVGFTVLSLAIALGSGGTGLGPALPLPPFLRFGARGYLGYLAALGTIRIDQVFVGPILGARQLGYYAVAASIAQLPLTLGRAVASRAFGTVAQSDDPAELMSRYMRLSLLVSGILAVAVAVVCPLVPLLYGRSFRYSLVPLLWLLPGSVVLCGSLTATSCLTSAGRPGQTTIAEAIGLAGTLAGLPLIVPRYGIRGAAIFSSITYLVVFLTYRHFLRRLGVTRMRPRIGDIAILRTSVGRLLRRPARPQAAPRPAR
jgi:O-antigen/teichoic acid export membrane protein